MCNFASFSTDSDEDFASLESDQFRIECVSDERLERLGHTLMYAHRWRLASRYGGCSCHYRHRFDAPPSFQEPEDEFPEDEDDVLATQVVYDVSARIVHDARRLDCVDSWNFEGVEDLETYIVDVAEVSREAFRFFEGWRFDFVDSSGD